MIPLKDKVIRRRFPVVNVAIILVNVAIFLLEWSLPPRQLEAFIFDFGFVPERFFGLEGLSGARTLPLLSSMYLHGGWLHLGSNMLTLWVFGDNVEDRMGHVSYLLFYTFAGFAATFAQALTEPASPLPIIGASGAIAGVLGAYLLLFPRARVVTLIPIFFFITVREVSALFFILFWFVLQLFNGVMALDPMTAEAGIAWWAHIGGFLVGVLFALPLGGRSRPYLPPDGPTWDGY